MEFDNQIEDLLYADEVIRSSGRFIKYKFILVEEPWTMKENPWLIEWVGKVHKELCAIPLVQQPIHGEKYVLVTTILEEGDPINYIFLRDQYHTMGE